YAVKLEHGQVWVDVPVVRSSVAPEEWLAVAEVAGVRPGTVRHVQAGAASIALVCSTAGIYALDNACSHEGGPLGEGSVEGTTVRCPLHGWAFDARTGACLSERGHSQRTFETKIAQGKVWVRVASNPVVSTP